MRTGTRVELLAEVMTLTGKRDDSESYVKIPAGEWGTVMGVTGAHVAVDFDNFHGTWGIAPADLKTIKES